VIDKDEVSRLSVDVLSRLQGLVGDPYSYARAWKGRTGGKVMGFFCHYAPEEIIHAAGALPARITGENRVISESGAHLQSYCCSLARTGLDMALGGDLDFLDGTVFVHTCDTMQRLSDIWRLNAGYDVHLDVVLPGRLEGDSAWEYLCRELASFRERLGELVGPVDDGALRTSIALYNRNRALLADLYRLRRRDPGVLPSDKALMVVAASALMDKEEHNALLEELLGNIEARLSGAAPGGLPDRPQEEGVESRGQAEARPQAGEKVRLFGIGSVMDQWEFLAMVEDVGGTVIDDDFCTGHRYAGVMAPEYVDPIESIARRIWDGVPCPCKHVTTRDRAELLLERITGSGAEGVLFFQFKFCEPHAFDYPYVKKALDERGIPSLHLEIEQGSVSIPRLRTRVEALLETIRG